MTRSHVDEGAVQQWRETQESPRTAAAAVATDVFEGPRGVDRDGLSRVLTAEQSVDDWHELRDLVVGWGGIRPGPDWGRDSLPPPLVRRNGRPVDELARVFGDLGLLPVDTGTDLVVLAALIYDRYMAARDLVVNDPFCWSVLEALDILGRLDRPWTIEDLRRLIGRPRHPNALGGAGRALCRNGAIRPIGVTNARRGPSRGHLVRTWAVARP